MEEFKSNLKSWLLAILVTLLLAVVVIGISLIFLYAPLWVKVMTGIFLFSGTILVGDAIAKCVNDDIY